MRNFLVGFALATSIFLGITAIPANAAGQSVAAQIVSILAKLGEGTPYSITKRVLPIVEKSVYQIECGNSVGSGFGLDVNLAVKTKNEGYLGAVITNHHVVEKCTSGTGSVKVTQNGRNLGGRVELWDQSNDLALVATIGEITPIKLAGIKPVRGSFAMAVGSPFGLEGSVSAGMVSNFDPDTVVTDAAVDPGNSGGPLVNSDARLIGINAWGWEGSKGNSHAILPGVLCRQLLVCSKGNLLLEWSK